MQGNVLVGSGMTILAVKGQETWLQGETDLHLEEPCREIFETSAWVSKAHVLLKGTRSQLQKQKHNHHGAAHQGAHSSPCVGAYISQSQPLQCILCIFKVFP